MNIKKDLVASIDYTLKDDKGEVLDTSDGHGPLFYIHGHGYLIPGLERQLEGKESGDSFSTVIEPVDGYGEYDEGVIFTVNKSQFDEPDALEVGLQFQAEIGGEGRICTVMELVDDSVKVDPNHPLAGMTLHFDVEVKDVREATAEELEYGHVHGEGDHHH